MGWIFSFQRIHLTGEGDGGMNAMPKANIPGTIAKATGMMKGSAPNPMSMGAVAKGAALGPLAPLSMPLAMPPFPVTLQTLVLIFDYSVDSPLRIHGILASFLDIIRHMHIHT